MGNVGASMYLLEDWWEGSEGDPSVSSLKPVSVPVDRDPAFEVPEMPLSGLAFGLDSGVEST
ncbi:hypothetical protein Lalb_Chr01g0010361 [Lupinus albus]|uniref:Uncharacterized protein n=1 Tax=Lupinus albus TaxID=3870 RepID=A0A6A4R509_LUPAL|nr:hypothetical protein Lalb_Chr01g0010361 [Lupinus albus]